MIAAGPALRANAVRPSFLACLALCACSGGGGAPVGPGPAPRVAFAHVIIVFQENRSPDNLFHGLPNADTNPSSGPNSLGQQVPLTPADLNVDYDMGHGHGDFLTEWDGGKLDGWNDDSGDCTGTCPPQAVRPYEYVPEAQVQEYWDLAQQYVFADRMFQSNRGPSFPAHQYIISGTAAAAPANPAYEIADNPEKNPLGAAGGCNSPTGSLVALIDPVSGNAEGPVFPCFDHPVLMDLLDAKHVSWRYYQPQAPGSPGLWTLDAISHIVDGPDLANISAPNTNILGDIASGNLPAVSWVIPTFDESDHPEGGALGPAWVASIANAVGSSAYWNSTAIVVTWDDWGGWYDHVAPPTRNADELGFRVPLIVVSPYSKSGYVSHVQYEFGSILKFVEEQFGLGDLGYTDAAANDLADCFNFSQAPRPYRQIASKHSRSYFMHRPNDTRPVDDR